MTPLTVYDAGRVAAAASTGRTLVTTDGGTHEHAPTDVAIGDVLMD